MLRGMSVTYYRTQKRCNLLYKILILMFPKIKHKKKHDQFLFICPIMLCGCGWQSWLKVY